MPPCKHFKSAAEFFNRKHGPLFKQEEWLMMNQINRDLLIRAKKNAQMKLQNLRLLRNSNLNRTQLEQENSQIIN